MPAKNASKTSTNEYSGFSAEERAAMQERAAELRAEGKKGEKKADGLKELLDKIAEMAPDDRALAERVHVTVTATAPDLTPKTWYGMPAYANADGKVVVFFQDAGKFKYRYATLGFQDAANLDDGDMWRRGIRTRRVEPRGTKEGRRPGEGGHLLTNPVQTRRASMLRRSDVGGIRRVRASTLRAACFRGSTRPCRVPGASREPDARETPAHPARRRPRSRRGCR